MRNFPFPMQNNNNGYITNFVFRNFWANEKEGISLENAPTLFCIAGKWSQLGLHIWSCAAPLLFSCSGREKFHRHHLTSQPLQPLLPPPPPHDQQHHKEQQDPNQDAGDGHQHLQPFVGPQPFLTLHHRLDERRDCTCKQGHGIRGLSMRTKIEFSGNNAPCCSSCRQNTHQDFSVWGGGYICVSLNT